MRIQQVENAMFDLASSEAEHPTEVLKSLDNDNPNFIKAMQAARLGNSKYNPKAVEEKISLINEIDSQNLSNVSGWGYIEKHMPMLKTYIIDKCTEEDLDLYQAQLIATSLVDNGIWIYDQELFQLIKVNKGFERIYESGNLEQILQKDSLNPSHILEHKDNVYMVCPKQGVLVFDIYGSYIKTVPVLNVDEIQIENKIIYYQKEGNYYGYGLIDFEEVKIQLPFDSFEKIRLEKDRLIVLSKNKIAIYSIGNK
jgi:hypothetical protein